MSSRSELIAALTLAEDVLSRFPYSTEIWPNGVHPQIGITQIRDALDHARTADGPEPVAWLDMRSEPAADWTKRIVATNPEYVTANGPENFVALYTHPVPDGPAPAVSEAEVEAAFSAWVAAPGLGLSKVIMRTCLEAAQRARK